MTSGLLCLGSFFFSGFNFFQTESQSFSAILSSSGLQVPSVDGMSAFSFFQASFEYSSSSSEEPSSKISARNSSNCSFLEHSLQNKDLSHVLFELSKLAHASSTSIVLGQGI